MKNCTQWGYFLLDIQAKSGTIKFCSKQIFNLPFSNENGRQAGIFFGEKITPHWGLKKFKNQKKMVGNPIESLRRLPFPEKELWEIERKGAALAQFICINSRKNQQKYLFIKISKVDVHKSIHYR